MAYAFVTLVTSDAYLPGALVVASALRDLHTSPAQLPEVDFQTVCLVTPETVDVRTIKLLRRAFDLVVGVEVIAVDQSIGLELLGRPDLHAVLTKLHMLRLTQFDKVIFLDADVLPLRPLSHLFTLPHEFAAVSDVGWPDIFNSGVMVFNPGEDKFNQVMALVHSKGSWDGGDQGVLNEWRGDNWHRLSFKYNTTPTAAYTYAPAYERFGSSICAIHFIGPNKPWSSIPFRAPASQQSHPSSSAPQSYAYSSLVDRWYSVYDKHFRPVDAAPEQQKEVQKYASAWNDGAEDQISYRALSLDELKRLAIEGVSASGIVGQQPTSSEGFYRALPLEGRVDLIRLAPALPTPLPHEVPAAPLQRTYSLPPLTPQGPSPAPPPPNPPRLQSPPKITWNPAVEPPPKDHPPASHFPIDAFFPNVWDKQPRQAPKQRGFDPIPMHQSPSSPPTRGSLGMSTSLQYGNAWDHVPSIQKYATRLMRPNAPPVPPPVDNSLSGGQRRRRSESYPAWDEDEDSSRDGDVEDEESDSEQSTRGAWTVSNSRDSDAGHTVSSPTTSIAPTVMPGRTEKSRSRRGSRAMSPPKNYRSQGTQTPRDRGGQAIRRKPRAAVDDPKVYKTTGVDADDSGTDPAAIRGQFATAPRSGKMSPPSKATTQTATTARPRIQTLPSDDVVLSPGSSTPTSALASPLSRPQGRSWDPARGVDVFKKSSEEVLARFLRLDSWDESPQHVSPPAV